MEIRDGRMVVDVRPAAGEKARVLDALPRLADPTRRAHGRRCTLVGRAPGCQAWGTGLLPRANGKTDVVEMLGRDHAPGCNGREAERLPESIHIDGQDSTANGGRGTRAALGCAGLGSGVCGPEPGEKPRF